MKFSIDKSILITIIILVLVNISMMFFPLVNIIGYEFSVINGILFFLLAGFRAIKIFSSEKILDGSLTHHFEQIKSFLLIAIFIPLLLGMISTILFSECPFGDGLLFYLVIALPNIFFGFVIGLLLSIMTTRFRKSLFILIFFLILIIPVIEIYYYPQVYFYNLIIGFFPGTIYDEDLSVDNLLLSYRIFNIAFCISLYSVSLLVHKKVIKKISSLSLVILVLITFLFLKPVLNFSTNLEKIRNVLKGKIETEHFEILYPKSIDKSQVIYIALLHEYYFEQVLTKLEIDFNHKITSIVFKDENQKRKLIGAGRADIAKPWLNQIYLNYPTFDETLKHEIVHVIAGKFGTTPFKVAENLNPGMIEGFAMAIEDNFDGFNIHHMAKIAYRNKYKISVRQLFSGLNFFTNYSSISYIYSGSFIKYLHEKYGMTKLKELYSDINFVKYYDKDIIQLEKEYEIFLNSFDIDINRNMAQLYFGGHAIFKKFCARTAATKTKKAYSYFNLKKYFEAKNMFEEVYNYSGSYSSLSGLVNSFIRLKKYDDAEKILVNESKKLIYSPYRFHSELLLGDIYILNDKYDLAKSTYDSLLIQYPSIDYYNEAFVRGYLLTNHKKDIKSFILGDRKERYEILRRINEDKLIYSSIPMMLYYSANNSELKNLILFLQNKIEVKEKISSYAVMKISEVAARLGYYDIAKEYAVKSLAFNNEDLYRHPLNENLKLINWLANFSEETLKKISIE